MNRLKKSSLIVLKVGTNTLMKNNRVSKSIIKSLAQQISAEMDNGKRFILVSSGAVGFGAERLGIKPSKMSPALQQATAAVGQNILMHEYEKAFSKHNQPIAQILLTSYNFQNQKSLSDLKNSIGELLKLKVVPIINENDPVSVEELDVEGKFDDNDGLASLVATELGADLLVLFSDVGGIYTANPKECRDAKMLHCIEELNSSRVHFGKKSELGVGGAEAKLNAVKKTLASNISVIVCCLKKDSLKNIFSGKASGSVFLPEVK
jgi:glutamate 5-kinase